jgi:F0F1-type ATP synthase delta subunit
MSASFMFENLLRQKRYYEAHDLLHTIANKKLIEVAENMLRVCEEEDDLQFVNQILGELQHKRRQNYNNAHKCAMLRKDFLNKM